MKIYFNLFIALLALTVVACEQNEVLPGYEYVGTSTATVANLSLSADSVGPGGTVIITMSYVNMGEDPATSLQLLQSIDEGEFTEVVSFDEEAAPVNQEMERTFTYTVPVTLAGVDIRFDMLLSSQQEFPQRLRAELEVGGAPPAE